MTASILIVEDNPDNCQLVTWILEDEGYQVTPAACAEEGIRKLLETPFDIVLMDISLPGMDGKQATTHIRAMDGFQKLPIIALTAHAIKGEHEAILSAGVTDLLTKPLDESLLLACIERHLQQPG
ncbi:response regulator [Exilibacterium tricleocarpae]|uniref:Response regulator n=1 Tax=Exilibacterium tricleocarpae TaxID=2591008 RepID=A0A545T0M8_9GAMM|nr:response regulator [Exilibacterium tricleocarpae]TQV70739.1 response regulator [Exilibacterium tricleocarpae]